MSIFTLSDYFGRHTKRTCIYTFSYDAIDVCVTVVVFALCVGNNHHVNILLVVSGNEQKSPGLPRAVLVTT